MPRLYTPISLDDVEQLLATGECEPVAAFGVTPELRDVLPDADDEEREHLATQLAAATSRHNPVAVAVFEAPSEAAQPLASASGDPLGAFRLAARLRHRDLVCFLVADPGESVSDDADLELSWYDAGELGAVRELLSASHSG